MAIEYYEPVQAFRFLIQVGGDAAVSAAFASCSGVRMNADVVESRDGNDDRGVKTGVPVFTRFDPVTLRKGVIGDNDFLDWMLASFAGLEAGPTGKDLKRDIDVITLNDKGEPAVTWTLKDAMPIAYELSPLDGSRSEVLMESITFSFGGMRRTTASNSRTRSDP